MAGQQWQQGDNANSDDIFMLLFWPCACVSLSISPTHTIYPLPKRNSPSITIFVKRKNFRPKKKKNTDNFCFPLPQEFLAAKVQEKAKIPTKKKQPEKKSG